MALGEETCGVGWGGEWEEHSPQREHHVQSPGVGLSQSGGGRGESRR